VSRTLRDSFTAGAGLTSADTSGFNISYVQVDTRYSYGDGYYNWVEVEGVLMMRGGGGGGYFL